MYAHLLKSSWARSQNWQPAPGGGRYIIFNDYYPDVPPGESHFGPQVAGIYYKPGLGAFGVSGTFFEIYNWGGGPFGKHGYPIDDESYVQDRPNWRRQTFERAADWRPETDPGYGQDDRFVSNTLWFYWDGADNVYYFPKDIVDVTTDLTQWH